MSSRGKGRGAEPRDPRRGEVLVVAMVFWVGEGEEGEREWLPCFPPLSPRPGTHTAHTFSPTTRRRRHSRVSARLPLPHCGARRQTAEEQRAPLLVCPTPPLRRSSRRGVEAGLGTGASKHTRPFHNLPPRRTAPLACGLFNHSPEKKKRRHSTRHAAGLQQRHLRSKIQ